MIKLKVIAVGKDKDSWVTDGCAHYLKLLKRFATVEIKIVPSVKSASSMPPDQIMKMEAERLTKEMTRATHVALTDTGKKMDTASFSKWLTGQVDTSGGMISFIIGGAYGLDKDVLAKADQVISLSPLTFSHQLVRLVLLEQLYRAFSVAHGTDYHK